MRLALIYGVITGGGCERRMGDIVRWMLDHGDDAWIIASTYDALGETVLHGQCGVPLDRVLYYNTGDGFAAPTYEQFVLETVRKLNCHLVDVQWHPGYNVDPFPCKAVATQHGISSAPPPNIFDGVIAVENGIADGSKYKAGAAMIWNWVNLKRFPFREQLGDGICFIGRAFKAVNVRKVASFYHGTIDGFGTSNAPILDYPENFRWHGFGDPADIMPRYRVVLASAQTAMEAMAAGRSVIAGQSPHLPNMGTYKPEGCLVTPDNVDSLARANSFSYRRGYEPTQWEVWADVQTALENDLLEERKALRAWVEEKHHIETQIEAIRKYYYEVL